MEINDLSPESFRDIFTDPKTQIQDGQQKAPAFGSQFTDANLANDQNNLADDLNKPDVNLNDPNADPNKQQQNQDDPNKDQNTDLDADLTGDKNNKGRKPKYDFTDASGYFADRFKSGKLVAIEEELEDGTKRPFIPKTPEEFDEVIDLQVNYQVDQKAKELEEKWYTTKSPAWQAVAKYAEMTDDPAEIIPFIQGIQAIDSVSDIDENEAEGAEYIIRMRLAQRGEPKEIIDSQIEAYKSSDKLISTAKAYKPLILKEEQQYLTQLVQKQKQEEDQYRNIVNTVKQQTIKALDIPLFGKNKLKSDEKQAVYELIGEPDSETKGYRIYSEIDGLFEKGDFETLRQVALLLKKKDSFLTYVKNDAANKTAADAMRKIKVATDSRSGNADDDVDDDNRRVVTRSQYTTPRFGRA